ncbi:MAG TPA: Ig-like domain-containing protein, partial [Mangrovimonas sp.]|nr:Ig-like domain-containing protein [Mangrovimonas sp.]
MKKNYTLTGVFIILGLLTSCSSDNGSEYTPLATQVIADAVETNQNTSVVVNIFSNDVDVPSNGILTVTNPSHGSVEIQTGSTANTILDDTVLYTPSNDYYGTDTFQYTICSA